MCISESGIVVQSYCKNVESKKHEQIINVFLRVNN
jgi:hypothetical protein